MRGYREVDGSCVAIQIPANGYYVDSSSGSGWDCDRGFRAVKEACVAVVVLENAHLKTTRTGWKCNRLNKKRRKKCVLPRREQCS